MIVPDTSKMSETDKMIWYQNEKKNPVIGMCFAIIPTAGHAYAGDWNRGILFKGAEGLSLALNGVFKENDPIFVIRHIHLWVFYYWNGLMRQ